MLFPFALPLAQAAYDPYGSPTAPAEPAGKGLWATLHLPHHFPGQDDLLTVCQHIGPGEAALLILVGVVYMFWGFSIYRYLVTINAAVLGLLFGAVVGEKIGSTVAGAIVGGFTFGAVTWPLMKHAVAIMGGVFGAAVGAGIWRACNQPPDMWWAGALTGMVLFGLMAFILFRNCIIVYLSLQGAVMMLFGLVGLASKYHDFTPRVGKMLGTQPLLLPSAIFIPCMIGLIYQHVNAPKPKLAGGGGGGAPPPGGPPKK